MAGNRAEVATQRAGVLCELPALLREQGASAEAVFAGSGLDPTTLHAELRVPLQTLVHLLDRAAEATGLAHLGLMLGLRFRLEHHGVIGRLMRTAPTLQQALADFVTWQPGYSSGAVVYLARFGDDALFGYAAQEPASPRIAHVYYAVAGVGLSMVAQLTAGRARPREIRLGFREPGDAAQRARLVRVPMRFDQERTCVVLDAEALCTPLPGADAAARARVQAEIEAALPAAFPRTALRTRHALRPLLQAGRPSMPATARALGLHPRTLRRRLAAEGETFESLRDGVRFTIAREFLEMTDLPIGEIAAATAFASSGVFAEAFRRWAGMSPSQWRSERRG